MAVLRFVLCYHALTYLIGTTTLLLTTLSVYPDMILINPLHLIYLIAIKCLLRNYLCTTLTLEREYQVFAFCTGIIDPILT